jgi:hypothetical protein
MVCYTRISYWIYVKIYVKTGDDMDLGASGISVLLKHKNQD